MLLVVTTLPRFLDNGDPFFGEVVEFVDEAADFLVRRGDLALLDPALVLHSQRLPDSPPCHRAKITLALAPRMPYTSINPRHWSWIARAGRA